MQQFHGVVYCFRFFIFTILFIDSSWVDLQTDTRRSVNCLVFISFGPFILLIVVRMLYFVGLVDFLSCFFNKAAVAFNCFVFVAIAFWSSGIIRR